MNGFKPFYNNDRYLVPEVSCTLKSLDSLSLFNILLKCSDNSFVDISDFFLNLLINSLTVIGLRLR